MNENNNDKYNRKLAFKNNTTFTACISKIHGVLVDNGEDLDVVLSMYNLLECSKNYEKTIGSLWKYYWDEPKDGAEGNRNEKITTSFTDLKSFSYKTKITGELKAGENRKYDFEIAVALKHLSNFRRTLNILLINCELSLTLTWLKNWVVTTRAYREKSLGTGTDGKSSISWS